MFKGLEHTAIATPDPEALGQWYAEKLDFPVVYRYAGNVFVRAADGTMLELIPSEGDRLETGMKTPGIRHLAVSVDDFEAMGNIAGGSTWVWIPIPGTESP